MRYSFPGNVGELEQMVDRAAALGRNAEPLANRGISAASKPVPILGRTPAQLRVLYRGFDGEGRQGRAATSATLAVARESFERDYILSVLKQVDGSRTSAAAVLGLSRKALWDKCKRYGISSAKGEAEEGED